MTLTEPLKVCEKTAEFHGHDVVLPVGSEISVVAVSWRGMEIESGGDRFYHWPAVHGRFAL